MKVIKNPKPSTLAELLTRPVKDRNDIEAMVSDVFSEVERFGDAALTKYTHLFDGINLENFAVTPAEIENATISEQLSAAIQTAHQNITVFHRAQQTKSVKVETMPGVECWQEKKAIERVGLYIPGGTAPLFSSILMLAIPAQLAGCKKIVLCTPPNKDGKIDPSMLYTAAYCGITKVYKVGGVQAIAAMTFGTESIPKVFKLFGPGNQFVTAAKQFATRLGVAIDMPAGPSELLVYADDSANPAFVAADMLSQAEHGPDSQVLLVTTSTKISKEVQREIDVQLDKLPRKNIAGQALENSKVFEVASELVAVELINSYAPEHLILATSNEQYFLNRVVNAGSVFVGNFTPESAGDYASGTNHTLPTNGFAKQYSGVNLDSFMKSITYQKISPQGIKNIGGVIECMAQAEGLTAHKNAVRIRLEAMKYE